MTKRRVQYIQDKISGGGGGGTGGGHKNDPSYAKKRESAKHGAPATTPAGNNGNDGTPSSARSAPAAKKISRGAIHGGGGPAQGKAGAADRRPKEGGGGEEGEEAGADFLAELRERFVVDKEELAVDADLDLLADDVLFAAAPPASSDGALSGQEVEEDDEEEEEEEEEEAGEATAATEGIEVEGGLTAAGIEDGDGGAVEQAEERPDSGELRLLEEIKTMKVCEGQHSLLSGDIFGAKFGCFWRSGERKTDRSPTELMLNFERFYHLLLFFSSGPGPQGGAEGQGTSCIGQQSRVGRQTGRGSTATSALALTTYAALRSGFVFCINEVSGGPRL